MAALIAGFLATVGPAVAQQDSRMDGCLARQGDQYVLLQGPPRTTYLLRGNSEQLKQHMGELVRVSGRLQVARGSAAFIVTSLDRLASHCWRQIPPGSATDAITGKTGPQGVSIPVTTTGTVGETTPGVQTGAGIAQQPGIHTLPATPPPISQQKPGAPPDWEMVGQTPEEANRNAEASSRALIEPGATLGVTSPPPTTTPVTAPRSTAKRTSALPGATATPVVVEMKGELLKFLPAKVTIKVGQKVTWKNDSKEVHNIVGDPQKAVKQSDVHLPAGAQAFDSGFLSPGQAYSHKFTVPGTYTYVCSLHEVQKMAGEIVVTK